MDPVLMKAIAEVGSTVVLAALFAWLMIKEMPAQRRENAARLEAILKEERQARAEDRTKMVEALEANTKSNAKLNESIATVCKHTGCQMQAQMRVN